MPRAALLPDLLLTEKEVEALRLVLVEKRKLCELDPSHRTAYYRARRRLERALRTIRWALENDVMRVDELLAGLGVKKEVAELAASVYGDLERIVVAACRNYLLYSK